MTDDYANAVRADPALFAGATLALILTLTLAHTLTLTLTLTLALNLTLTLTLTLSPLVQNTLCGSSSTSWATIFSSRDAC